MQIRPHCNAFRSGLSTVIDISWLRMFDPNELQVNRIVLDIDCLYSRIIAFLVYLVQNSAMDNLH